MGLSALGLLASGPPAHAGGQGREPDRGHPTADWRSRLNLPPVAAKVVTEHVPVLPIPGIWKPPVRRKESGVLAKGMGFRTPARKPLADAPVRPVPKPAPTVKPAVAPPPRVKAANVHLRAGRAMLAAGDHEGALVQFRLGEDTPDALLGIALVHLAEGRDEAAARAIRKAVRREPSLVRHPRDIAGRYRDAEVFETVLSALEKRARAIPGNADAKFALAFVRYFTGDARCRETFAWFVSVTPTDMVADLFLEGARRKWPPEKKDPGPVTEGRKTPEIKEKPSSTGRREGVMK